MLAHAPSQARFSCLPAMLPDMSEEWQWQVSAIPSICKHYPGSEGQLRTHGEVHVLSFQKSVGKNCVRAAGWRERFAKLFTIIQKSSETHFSHKFWFQRTFLQLIIILWRTQRDKKELFLSYPSWQPVANRILANQLPLWSKLLSNCLSNSAWMPSGKVNISRISRTLVSLPWD